MNITKSAAAPCMCSLLMATAGLAPHAVAGQIGIVVPPGQETVESEGAISRFGSLREQSVYLAANFAAMPPTHRLIVGYALRPDQSISGPAEITYQDVELRLSSTTAAPGTIGTEFAENVGTDETLVFTGDLTLSTDSTGMPGGPHDFDMQIMFSTPFAYDPSQGNLLIDFQSSGSVGSMAFDAHQPDRSIRLVNGPRTSPTAASTVRGIYIRRFIFVPEPNSLVLLITGIAGVMIRRRKRH